MPDPKTLLNITDFLDKEGKVKFNLINNEGQDGLNAIIKVLTGTDDFQREGGRPARNAPLNINQLRKFYDSFLRIYNAKIAPEEKKVQLLMLKANSEYSANRLKNYYFGYFFQQRVNLVLKKSGEEFDKNLKALKLHLEALVGYYPKN